MDFTFEIISETTINIRFNYGGEWFTFNLFHSEEDQWILHPFDSMLIRNKDMSRLVIADLLQNKTFQVMLAREGIVISELNTSIPLGRRTEEDIPEPIPQPRGSRYDSNPDIIVGNSDLDFGNGLDIEDLIQHNDLEDLLRMEIKNIDERQSIYNKILQIMFMNDLGPADAEFQKVQQVVKGYEEVKKRFQMMLNEIES